MLHLFWIKSKLVPVPVAYLWIKIAIYVSTWDMVVVWPGCSAGFLLMLHATLCNTNNTAHSCTTNTLLIQSTQRCGGIPAYFECKLPQNIELQGWPARVFLLCTTKPVTIPVLLQPVHIAFSRIKNTAIDEDFMHTVRYSRLNAHEIKFKIGEDLTADLSLNDTC